MPDEFTRSSRIYIWQPAAPLQPIIINNIESGTQVLQQILIEENAIQFGRPHATMYEANIWVPTTVTLAVNDTIDVRCGADVVEVSNTIFKGELFSATPVDGAIATFTESGNEYTAQLYSIIAYDFLYNSSKINVADWWNNVFYEGTGSSQTLVPRTIKYLIQSLLTYCNIISAFSDWNNLPNATTEITRTKTIDNISLADMLTYLCQFCACIPYCYRNGNFYIWRFSTAHTVDYSNRYVEDVFEMGNSQFGETVPRLNRIVCVDGANNTLAAYPTYEDVPKNDNDAVYTIVDNPIIDIAAREIGTSLSDNPNTRLYILRQIYLELCSDSVWGQGTTSMYRLCEAKMIVSDLSALIGDKVVCQNGTFFIFENAFSGALLIEQSIKCNGDLTKNLEVGTYDTGSVMFNEVTELVDSNEEVVNDISSLTNDVIPNLSTTLNGRITATNGLLFQLMDIVQEDEGKLNSLIAWADALKPISFGDNYLQIGDTLIQWGTYTIDDSTDKLPTPTSSTSATDLSRYATHKFTISLPKSYDKIITKDPETGVQTVTNYGNYALHLTGDLNLVVAKEDMTYPRTPYFQLNAYHRYYNSFEVHAFRRAASGGVVYWLTIGKIPSND